MLLLVVMAPAGLAGPEDDGSAALKAWTAEVSPALVEELRLAGLSVTSEEVIDEETVRVEVIAAGKQLAQFRDEARFTRTRGQRRVDRTPDVAIGDNVFRPYDGPDGIEAELATLADANPDLVKLVDIGDTVQGRDIWALKITKNANRRPDGTKPAVLYNSMQHAREWITVEMTRRLARYFLDGYGTDDELTRIVDTTELWFVVVANPDGYQYTHEDPANRLWRKNLRDNDGDGEITLGDGVDLNRNFAHTWGYNNEGSSSDLTSETYRGPSPQSEPETQAMDGLLGRVDFAFQINWHSAAELLLYGNGWQVDTPTPDDEVSKVLVGTDERPAVPGYDPDQSAELYITNGDTTDHAHVVHGTVAHTPEMSTCQTVSNRYPDDEWEAGDCQSGFNFPDDESLIQEEFEDNIPYALDVAKSAQDPGNPVSHLGLEAPDMVVDEFAVSHGTSQQVQVTADRELGPVRMVYTVNGGKKTITRTSEWDGGERYGADMDLYYAFRRGTVKGTRPGDEVKVWFEARGTTSEPFTYTVADDIGGDVLIVADTDYGHALSGGVTDLRYVDYYGDAIKANGHTWDLYDVRATDTAPHPLGVLSHYDAVVWYTGDNLVTDYQGGLNTVLLAHEMTIALRDYLNEGGKLLATGKNVGFQEFFPLNYGEDGDPGTVCTSGDCLTLSNDFFQYWLGGYDRSRRGGLDSAGNALSASGIDVPYEGLSWDLDGGDSAANQGSAGGTNTTGTGTAAWIVTSDILPVDEFPQFESWGSADWATTGASPFAPRTGDWYMASQAANQAYKRLTRSVDLTGASSGAIEVAVSHDTEGDWDYVIVEAHTVGEDDWTTIEIPGVTSQDTGQSCPAGWQAQIHPFLEHYQTVDADGTCSPTGTTGEWNAVSGDSAGWQDWTIDLTAYAGSAVEVSISYVTDWATLETGVFVDDAAVIVDGATVAQTSFEADTEEWTVPGPPPGSPNNSNDWIRSENLFRFRAAVTTEDTVLHGFGFEGISTQEQRNAVMGQTLDHLLD